MGRGAEIAESFAADESFARDVADLADAVDAKEMSFIPADRYLEELRGGQLDIDHLAQRVQLGHSEFVEGLHRLENLGLIAISTTDDTKTVVLTAAGQSVAKRQLEHD